MSKTSRFNTITATMLEMYMHKNRMYGDSFGQTHQELGLRASVGRMSDKMNRIKYLATHPDDDKFESLEDNLMDIANYAVMTLIELQLEITEEDSDEYMEDATRS